MAGTDDYREIITLFGIHYLDSHFNHGTFSNKKKLLVKSYYNENCSVVSHSEASNSNMFLYPHRIKKTYFIEGVIEGEFTIAANISDSHITEYRVSVCRMNLDNTDEELFSTDWTKISDDGIDLSWLTEYSYGEEYTVHWEIDAWDKAKLGENDRIYLKIEVNSDKYCVLWHDNSATWEDVWVAIPLKM